MDVFIFCVLAEMEDERDKEVYECKRQLKDDRCNTSILSNDRDNTTINE